MSGGDDEFEVRPGRPRHGGTKGRQAKSFVGQVMRAANKSGRGGRTYGTRRKGGGISRFGRGRVTGPRRARHSTDRRVVVKMRIVQHRGVKFRAAPLSRHVSYLEREGVTRDGAPGRLFDAAGDQADGSAFADRCEDDRHHFRIIISPEDAREMEDLRAYTRELMADAQRDLGTALDWVAVDHWNTDDPHIHVLLRGRADDGRDLVMSRDYIREGFRHRAEDRVTLELGPRTQREIETALNREVQADRWTALDRTLRDIADRHGGIVDLRPDSNGRGAENRHLLVGRAQKLEAMGLADPLGPAAWTIKPSLEDKLRDLGVRGDIIKTMHKAMAKDTPNPDVSRFAIHHAPPGDPVMGRLVDRGLYDELKGSAYAVVDGIDGRTHHLRFEDLDMTGDAKPGAIVEIRSWEDGRGQRRHSLATRSDLSLREQITSDGATWLDRNLVSREQPVLGGGFGAEVAAAMESRADHLVNERLAERRGSRVIFARALIQTLKDREMLYIKTDLVNRTGLAPLPSRPGDHVAGIYRHRVTLASGRFAMIDNGLGFQLVPWRPALEKHLGQHVSGTMMPHGGVEWSFGKQRGLGL
ncbi:MAG: DUF3363 domain-containing protein [Novosphingobium sp.]